MRILLYGFGPYKQFRQNITAKIVRSVPKKTGLRKLVFPVRFDRAQFIKALDRYRPDIVLGLGQSSRRGIEIETRAANRRRANKKDSPKPIRRNGPKSLAATLALRLGRQARRSNNAGDYVCNYSMYVVLDQIKRKGLQTAFGFLHIPHDYNVRKAGKLVRAVLKKLKPV
jgi:pyroglutamyl-peptidase